MKFHVIKLGSRPLLAVPCGKHSLWSAAIDCYPAHTGKKRLVRKVLHGLAGVGLIRWVFPSRELSLPGVGKVDFEAWMALLGEQLHLAELQPVLVWPADPLRGRVYMYLLNKKGEKVGFCKLGLDAKNNALIERERQALEDALDNMSITLKRSNAKYDSFQKKYKKLDVENNHLRKKLQVLEWRATQTTESEKADMASAAQQ